MLDSKSHLHVARQECGMIGILVTVGALGKPDTGCTNCILMGTSASTCNNCSSN